MPGLELSTGFNRSASLDEHSPSAAAEPTLNVTFPGGVLRSEFLETQSNRILGEDFFPRVISKDLADVTAQPELPRTIAVTSMEAPSSHSPFYFDLAAAAQSVATAQAAEVLLTPSQNVSVVPSAGAPTSIVGMGSATGAPLAAPVAAVAPAAADVARAMPAK